ELGEAFLDRRARTIEQRLRDVDERDRESGLRKHLGNSVPHGAGTDDADVLDHVVRRSTFYVRRSTFVVRRSSFETKRRTSHDERRTTNAERRTTNVCF